MGHPLILTRGRRRGLDGFSRLRRCRRTGFSEPVPPAAPSRRCRCTYRLRVVAFMRRPPLLRADQPYFRDQDQRQTFPAIRCKNGLPTIQGAIVLCDANKRIAARRDGFDRDHAEPHGGGQRACCPLSCRAPGFDGPADPFAAAAIRAARSSRHCGTPCRSAGSMPGIPSRPKPGIFADEMTSRWGLDVAARPRACVRPPSMSDVHRHPARRHARRSSAQTMFVPATFIAAVGADSHDKSELQPGLMANATVVADVIAQCVVMGRLASRDRSRRDGGSRMCTASFGDLVVGEPSADAPGRGRSRSSIRRARRSRMFASAVRVYERGQSQGCRNVLCASACGRDSAARPHCRLKKRFNQQRHYGA